MKDSNDLEPSVSPLDIGEHRLQPLPDDISDPMLIELGLAMQQAPVFRSENTSLAAGYTYFGQFVDHDMMFFTSAHTGFYPRGEHPLRNQTGPELDLQCVYGSGFNDPAVPVDALSGKLALTALDGGGYDLPRAARDTGVPGQRHFRPKGTAQVADGRSDDHLLLSQLHVLFLRLHNVLVEHFTQGEGRHRYEQARRWAGQIYRQLVREDFLKTLLLAPIWRGFFGAEKRSHRPLFSESQLLSANVFHLAVFRFGHAMVRENYALNDNQQVRLHQLFDYRVDTGYFQTQATIPASHCVDWRYFFGPEAQNALFIQPVVKLTVPILKGPVASLAVRNLLRAREQQVPTAQSLLAYLQDHPDYQSYFPAELVLNAANMDMPGAKQILSVVSAGERFCHTTPLWFYVLREAYETRIRGFQGQLGPLASIVVATVFDWLLKRSQSAGEEPLPLSLQELNTLHKLVKFVS